MITMGRNGCSRWSEMSVHDGRNPQYVYARVVKWLARRGLLREADASNEAPSYSAGEAMTLAPPVPT